MKKTNIITGIFAVLTLIFVFSACEKVDDPIRTETTKTWIPWGGDTTSGVYSEDKKVLLQDFTGHTCVNCPEAAIWAHEYSNDVDHKLIIMSVHAGWFSGPSAPPLNDDFRCEIGNDLFTFFNPQSFPAGVIDMVDNGVSSVYSPSQWEGVINQQLEKPFNTGIMVDANVNTDNSKLSCAIKIKAFEDPIGKYKFVACVVGDTIAAQSNSNEEIGPAPLWEDYPHHNVLITSMNGTWGQFVEEATGNLMVKDEEYPINFLYDLDPNWVERKLSIIVYVYDEETKEVIQVEECEVGKS